KEDMVLQSKEGGKINVSNESNHIEIEHLTKTDDVQKIKKICKEISDSFNSLPELEKLRDQQVRDVIKQDQFESDDMKETAIRGKNVVVDRGKDVVVEGTGATEIYDFGALATGKLSYLTHIFIGESTLEINIESFKEDREVPEEKFTTLTGDQKSADAF